MLGGNPPPTPPGSIEGPTKKHNENNDGRPEPCQSSTTALAETGKARIQNPLEVREEQSINQSDHDSARAHEVGEEGTADPRLLNAVRLMAPIVGSETDPDFDGAHAIANRWAASHGSEAVLDAVQDWMARKADRTESRQFGESLFARYVRQAADNIRSRSRDMVIREVEKPKQAQLVAGPLGDGMIVSDAGNIELINGVKAEWLDRFGGDEEALRLVLISIKGRVRVNSPTPVEAQVFSMLSDRAFEARQRSKNYETAVERSKSPRSVATVGGKKTETQSERLARIGRAIESEKAKQ